MDNEQPWNYSYKFTQSWPKNNWADNWPDDAFSRMLNDMTTDLTIYRQDMQEATVEKSNNTDAIRMLNNIGIKC